MTKDLYLYLLAVVVVSLIINLIVNKNYKISKVKLIIFTLISPIVGVICTAIMSYIESGSYRGTSFYGAIFLMPLYVLLFSIIFKIKFSELINLTSFLGMITSVVLKVRCYIYNCCGGRKINIFIENEGYLTFPSQIVEMIFAFIVLIILLILYFKDKKRKDLYPIMMTIYGAGRFILNSYRRVTPILGNMAWGHVWSIVSVFVGLLWLFVHYKKEKII